MAGLKLAGLKLAGLKLGFLGFSDCALDQCSDEDMKQQCRRWESAQVQMIFRGYGTAKMVKKRQAWEKMRQQGKRSYILRRGVLRWGGFMFVLTTCTDIFVRHFPPHLRLMVVGLIVWPLTGYAWGLAMWIMHERFFFGWPKKQPSNDVNQPEQAASE